MIKTVYLIVEEGADRVYVWATFPSSYVAPKDRRSQIIVVDIPLDGFEIAAGKVTPIVKGELVECPSCKRPEEPEAAVNHVAGHVFVGWGHGWQPCSKCGGSSRVLMSCATEVKVAEEVLTVTTDCKHAFDDRQQVSRGLIWCSLCGAIRQHKIGWLLPSKVAATTRQS